MGSRKLYLNYYIFFQIFFNYRHNLEFPTIDLNEINIHTTVEQISNNQIFELSCTIDEISQKNYKITIDFDQKKYFFETIKSFSDDFLSQIQKMSENLGEIPTQKQFNLINSNQINLNNDLIQNNVELNPIKIDKITLIEAFYEQCHKTPNNIAIQINFKSNQIFKQTYSNLLKLIKNNSINLKNQYFKQTGKLINSTDIIPILINYNKAVEWILTILEMGCAYSYIDPKTPVLKLK